MHSALNRIAALSVVFTLFSPSVLAAWQKHSNDERMPDRTATDFDGKALLRTAKALSLPANVDLRDLTAQQAIDQFGKTHKLTINIDSAGAAISEPVTLKSSATVGEILLELLGQIKCDFSIRPNGEIVVSKTANSLKSGQSKLPTFDELEQFAGTDVKSKDFQEFVTRFHFRKNHKRERSYGSGFGVFLEISKSGIVAVGVRPQGATNMPTYSGVLPKGLVAGDSVDTLVKKLGKPIRTTGRQNNYFTMYYDDFSVIATGGSLFEIWIAKRDRTVVRDAETPQPKKKSSKKSKGAE